MQEPSISHKAQLIQEHNDFSFKEAMLYIEEIKAKNGWVHIIATFYPLDKKYPTLSKNPQAHKLQAEIAFALSQLQHFEDAINVLKLCLEQVPNYYLYLSALAFNYYNALMADKGRQIRLGDNKRSQYFSEAEKYFKMAQAAFPEGVVDFYRQGMLYHHLSSTSDQKAIPFFLRAIENWEAMDSEYRKIRHKDEKNYIKSLYHLAKAYIHLGEGEKALDAIQTCIEEDEHNYEEPIHKFYIAGRAYYEIGNYKESIKYLRISANQKTKKPKDYIFELLSRCFMNLDENKKALEWIERIPFKFRKPYALRVQGSILAKAGDIKKAEEIFLEALRRDRQGKHKTFFSWGMMYYRRKDFQHAKKLFEKANKVRRETFANEYPDALFFLGCCNRELGDSNAAIENFKKVLSLNDRHHEAGRALRKLLGKEYDNDAQFSCEEEFSYEEDYLEVRDDIYATK